MRLAPAAAVVSLLSLVLLFASASASEAAVRIKVSPKSPRAGEVVVIGVGVSPASTMCALKISSSAGKVRRVSAKRAVGGRAAWTIRVPASAVAGRWIVVATCGKAGSATGSFSVRRTSPPPTPSPIVGDGYRLAFDDEFTTLDRSVWDDHIWYDDPPDPSWVGFQEVDSSGILHVRTSKAWVPASSGQPYPLNEMTTMSSGKTFRYGYFEARMKWDGTNGSFPAFWLYSYRHATNPSWPNLNRFCAKNGLPAAQCYSGELDVMEGQGLEPNVLYSTIHRNSCGCYGVSDQQNSNNYNELASRIADSFHVYGMLWTRTKVQWFLDGVKISEATPYDSLSQPMFLLLQTYNPQDAWAYDPSKPLPNVIDTQFDWVRVWQK